ncbi:restriction endonuclease subunit S [Micromonospora sp. SL1-18]|uniref:restriction endonuclease subunit S n=1 Tax=Micromonospora sp. SL1-18 TaxID=3399128 RepID=UPI003A4E3FB0
MAGEWIDTTLGEVLTLKRGYDLPTPSRQPGPYPVVSSSGVTGSHREAKVKGPGVVTGRYGTLGEVHYLVEDFWPLNTTLYVKDFKGSDPRFISYFLRSLDFLAYSDKSSVPGLNRNHLHLARIRVPLDIQEQRAIANFLGAFDDKIELNARTNSTLEAIAQALFNAWFVDFGPVKAKAIDAGGFGGVPSDVFESLPAVFSESEIGPIPAGWKVAEIGDIAALSRDSLNPAGHPTEVFEHFSIPAFDSGPSPASDLGASIKSSKYILPPNSVLVSKLNPRIARTWLPSPAQQGRRQIASTEFLVTLPRPGWSRWYLYCQFANGRFREELRQKVTGTSSSHQRVSPKDFERTLIVAPPQEVRDAFVRIVEPLFLRVASNRAESSLLAEARDAMLPRLLSGAIRAPSVEGGQH